MCAWWWKWYQSFSVSRVRFTGQTLSLGCWKKLLRSSCCHRLASLVMTHLWGFFSYFSVSFSLKPNPQWFWSSSFRLCNLQRKAQVFNLKSAEKLKKKLPNMNKNIWIFCPSSELHFHSNRCGRSFAYFHFFTFSLELVAAKKTHFHLAADQRPR